jgi:hypothetical protein
MVSLLILECFLFAYYFYIYRSFVNDFYSYFNYYGFYFYSFAFFAGFGGVFVGLFYEDYVLVFYLNRQLLDRREISS